MDQKPAFIWLESNKAKGASLNVSEGSLVIRLSEDLDHHNALWIREEADKLIERQNIRNIIFDFTDVNFMDSSGVGVIMGRYKKVIFTGGKAAVTGVGTAIDRIMKMTGLYKIIEKYDNVEEALRQL